MLLCWVFFFWDGVWMNDTTVDWMIGCRLPQYECPLHFSKRRDGAAFEIG